MIKTSYQTPELRDANDNVVQEGAFGKNTALSNSTNDAWIDYVMNDLEALHDTIGDSAPTLDGNGHVVEPANLAIGDEDGIRLKTGYLKTSGGTVSGTLNVAQNLKMQDNQENVFGGMYVPASSATSQFLQLYGGETPSSNGGNLQLPSDGSWTLQAKNGTTAYNLVGGTDGTLKWRGNNVAVTASPAFTGNPTAPTQATNNNSTRLATTEYVVNDLKANVPLLAHQFYTTLNNEDDLNDVTTAGTYRWTGANTSPVNRPTGVNYAKMFVIKTLDNNYTTQLVFCHVKSNGIWYRTHNGTTWTDWFKIAFAEEVLPLTGGTMTGAITQEATYPSSYSAHTIKYTGLTIGENPTALRAGYPLRFLDEAESLLGGLYYSISSAGIADFRLINNWHGDFGLRMYASTGGKGFFPSIDNNVDLGSGNYRWKQLYAATTTISTSDERLKDNIVAIPDAVLDAWGEVNWYQYQFKDSIAEKGETKARLHTGAIAQRIESVFNAHGLDANKYGLLCYDEWEYEPAERDEQGNIVQPARPAGNRYSLRYEEALCMEAAYQRRRADKLEERIARLEALISE